MFCTFLKLIKCSIKSLPGNLFITVCTTYFTRPHTQKQSFKYVLLKTFFQRTPPVATCTLAKVGYYGKIEFCMILLSPSMLSMCFCYCFSYFCFLWIFSQRNWDWKITGVNKQSWLKKQVTENSFLENVTDMV